jgi:hypothetical protein
MDTGQGVLGGGVPWRGIGRAAVVGLVGAYLVALGAGWVVMARTLEYGHLCAESAARDQCTLTEVWPDTAFARAGLRAGDAIVAVQGVPYPALAASLKPTRLPTAVPGTAGGDGDRHPAHPAGHALEGDPGGYRHRDRPR